MVIGAIEVDLLNETIKLVRLSGTKVLNLLFLLSTGTIKKVGVPTKRSQLVPAEA